jgi:hypothetical protein
VYHPRRHALLAEIERLDGRVYLVLPPSLRDDHGGPTGVSGRLLPRVALVGGRRDATLVAHDANRSARRPISRREVRPALDTLAGPLLDRVGGNDFVAASYLLVRLFGRGLARHHLRTDISLPARFHAGRATANQMGPVRVPSVVAADNDARRALPA